jgi:transcriptional regulator with XRE-family HTH domain
MRFNRDLKQSELAEECGMLQSRISAVETPGARLNVETLVRLAAALKVGLVVRFVPFSEMLAWDNAFRQDSFSPVTIDEDVAFLTPENNAVYWRQVGITTQPFSENQVSSTERTGQLAQSPMVSTAMLIPAEEAGNLASRTPPASETQSVIMGGN